MLWNYQKITLVFMGNLSIFKAVVLYLRKQMDDLKVPFIKVSRYFYDLNLF